MQPILPVTGREPPRVVLAVDFPSLQGGLPVQGGWGYAMEDACVFDKADPLVDPGLPFDFVGMEYIFVQKRTYEEMIICRPEGQKFSGIDWELLEQRLVQDGGRSFDKLVFKITALRDEDWNELKAEYEGPDGYGTPGFDAEAHEQRWQEKLVQMTREFWFDVTHARAW